METKFWDYFFQFFVHDWFASIPIFVCSVLTVAVVIERYLYYQKNSRDVRAFLYQLQRDLESLFDRHSRPRRPGLAHQVCHI